MFLVGQVCRDRSSPFACLGPSRLPLHSRSDGVLGGRPPLPAWFPTRLGCRSRGLPPAEKPLLWLQPAAGSCCVRGGGSWRSPCWRLWSLLDFADFPDAAWPSVVSSVLSAPSVRSTSFTLAEGSVLNTEPAVWVSDSNRGWRARLSASRVHRSRPAAPFQVSTGDSQASSPCGVPSPGIAELCVTARMRLQTGRGCHPCRC